jgi:hypothetical protein
MNMVSFFASVAENFKARYDSLSRALSRNETPDYYRNPSSATNTNIPVPVKPAEDSVEISPDARKMADDSQSLQEPETTSTAATPAEVEKDIDDEAPVTPENDSDEAQEPVETPDQPATYSVQQKSRLEYRMNLEFDLGTFTRTIEKLSEGDTKSVEELFAAGFGLSADLALRGRSVTQTTGGVESEATSGRQVSASRSRSRGVQANFYKAVGDNFAVESFTREAHRIRRSSLNINSGGHQLAINRFSMRYSLDSRFSVSNLNRFNVQTQQVADEMPESVNKYIDSAGQVAEKGSVEMMATFFDTVDSYLGQAEDRLIENAQAFLDAAAKELGFSEETMAMAKDHLVGSIENFFDRVDSAVSQLQAQYAPEMVSEPVQPEVREMVTPEQLYNPAVAEEEQTVALA